VKCFTGARRDRARSWVATADGSPSQPGVRNVHPQAIRRPRPRRLDSALRPGRSGRGAARRTNEAAAASAAEQAGSAALAREDAALQRAIDRKIDARMSAALAPPVKVRARSANVAARNGAPAKGPARGLYAAQ